MDNTITSVGGIETGTDNYNQVYQLNERLTWLRGRHTMKFGGSWNYYRSKSYYPGNNGHNGFISYTLFNFTGYPFADFLLDQVSPQGERFDVRRVDAPAASRQPLCRGRLQDQPKPDAESRTAGGRTRRRSSRRTIGRRTSISRTRRSSSPGATATAARSTTRTTTVGNHGSGSPTAKVSAGCSAAATGSRSTWKAPAPTSA